MDQHTEYDIIHFKAGNLTDAIITEMMAWQHEHKIERFWKQDPTLWTNSDENKWMGWLDIAAENNEINRINALANEIKIAGFTDIVLMGMGGSSLCPAMLAETFGKIKDYPRLHILDSTDPSQIHHLEKKLDLKKTFFIVSSKSGSTLEPNIFKDYFYSRLQIILNKKEVGDQFIAITDPNTSLEKIATKDHFKSVFYGVPSIGGRYSALSNFGMVPAGLMGINVKEFLQHAETLHQACVAEVFAKNNPAILLGIILGVCAIHGKNKITFIVSPEINTLGGWLEQLLAESTGKNGKGLIPVDQEPLGNISVYSEDRVFVYIRLDNSPDSNQDHAFQTLEDAGFVVIKLHIPDKMHLGAELFLWEIATDIAGSIIGIDPFNQPDVEGSKKLSLQLTDLYEKTGQLAEPKPFFSDNGISLFSDEKNINDIFHHLDGSPSIINFLRAHFNRVKPGDYVDFSAFIEMSNEHTTLLQKSRVIIRDNKKVATCLGYGPRFLHSTGQAYKGGPNTGVFLQITSDYVNDIKIPGHRYTFGTVIKAQAQADFSVLGERSRRILRIHLGKDVQKGLMKLDNFIQQALKVE